MLKSFGDLSIEHDKMAYLITNSEVLFTRPSFQLYECKQ